MSPSIWQKNHHQSTLTYTSFSTIYIDSSNNK